MHGYRREGPQRTEGAIASLLCSLQFSVELSREEELVSLSKRLLGKLSSPASVHSEMGGRMELGVEQMHSGLY